MRVKDLATRATKLLTGNAWFVVDNGTKVEKAAYSEVVKQGIEEYAGSTLAGSAQTVKSAIDALNSKTKSYDYTASSGSFLDWVRTTFTTNGEYYVVYASTNQSGWIGTQTGTCLVEKRNSDIFLTAYYNETSTASIQTIYTNRYVNNVWLGWTKIPSRYEFNALNSKSDYKMAQLESIGDSLSIEIPNNYRHIAVIIVGTNIDICGVFAYFNGYMFPILKTNNFESTYAVELDQTSYTLITVTSKIVVNGNTCIGMICS